MTVKSVSVYSSRAWGNQVKRRYQVTLADSLANDHIEVIGAFKVDSTDDGTAQANALLFSKKTTEIANYKDIIRSGLGNPFITIPAIWNNRVELLLPILTEALTNAATDSIVYNGLPYIALVTDDELIALFGKDQAWVDSLRLKAADLLSGKATFDAYIPPLGVG